MFPAGASSRLSAATGNVPGSINRGPHHHTDRRTVTSAGCCSGSQRSSNWHAPLHSAVRVEPQGRSARGDRRDLAMNCRLHADLWVLIPRTPFVVDDLHLSPLEAPAISKNLSPLRSSDPGPQGWSQPRSTFTSSADREWSQLTKTNLTSPQTSYWRVRSRSAVGVSPRKWPVRSENDSSPP